MGEWCHITYSTTPTPPPRFVSQEDLHTIYCQYAASAAFVSKKPILTPKILGSKSLSRRVAPSAGWFNTPPTNSPSHGRKRPSFKGILAHGLPVTSPSPPALPGPCGWMFTAPGQLPSPSHVPSQVTPWPEVPPRTFPLVMSSLGSYKKARFRLLASYTWMPF